ncbi:MAG: beta-ketoacyl synthase N-terminal-like domain-containing protein [Spirochaetota bacterium]|nr:beta-ketoacyl synthase N-terminal-like domain-containing protein [Spirochaetota bacterium]
MYFEPIAIIGQSCVLPGALNPQELWDILAKGQDVLAKVPDGYWRTDTELVFAQSYKDSEDRTWTDRGGYVRDFDSVFDPEGFAISKDEILLFDPLVHWIFHTGREALKDSGYPSASNIKAGAIFGNLSYPSHSLTQFAESVWLDAQANNFIGGKSRQIAGIDRPHPLNRFMSGLPAHMLARALELKAGAFALDAACASSLYAIKLACDKLHDREADLMLAGGVNRADDLIIHIGFCALQAMSHSGESRPFHRKADGLVPAEGAGFIVLKRLDDAIASDDTILGVIRGIGLSNDGRGHGLLVPSEEGQFRAIRQAYDISGLSPEDISLIECHATGTPIGDGVEIRSIMRAFEGLKQIPIGSIKSNMGHPITVSGIAGILKILGALKHGIRPPTLHVEEPLEIINDSPFRLLTEPEPWDSENPRRAVVNNFGFGGNNAHIIIEEWDKTLNNKPKKRKRTPKTNNEEIAIVGIGVMAADLIGAENFAQALFTGESRLRKHDGDDPSGFTESYQLPMMGLRFPPADLEQTLPQQLLVLKSTFEAITDVESLPVERTGALIGMGCDGEVARSSACWRLPQWVDSWKGSIQFSDVEDWISRARDHINPFRKAPSIVGAMPNIVANRLCSQFDLRGPSFTISSEEISGMRCLEIAVRALRANELDAAIVGAVDVCCEPVHKGAAKDVLNAECHTPGDASVILILKRLTDARENSDKIYAIISDKADNPTLRLGLEEDSMSLIPLFGHAHAASGLLHVAASALACYYKILPTGKAKLSLPWLTPQQPRSAEISVNALGGERSIIRLKEDIDSPSGHFVLSQFPRLHIYSGNTSEDVLHSLINGEESEDGPARLVITASDNDELIELQKKAQILLEKGEFSRDPIILDKGIYYSDNPIGGEIAFVFTGSAGVYPGMGRELMLAFPELVDEICTGFTLEEVLDLTSDISTDMQKSPERMLWSSTLLSQIHAKITQQYLGIIPDAVIGFSSGESNSLFATGAWRDLSKMFQEFRDTGVFTKEVGGEFNCIKRAWKDYGISDVDWINYGLLVPEDEAQSIIDSEPLVHIIVINAPGNIVIGGQAEACEGVVERLGRERAYKLGYDVAVHCSEMKKYADKWRKLHHRTTFPVPDIRFYSSSTCSHYQPNAELAADALLGMASQRLNFPKMVENAWNDGIRIFIEHGPRDSCSRWISQILGNREHVTIPMDRAEVSSMTQVIHVIAQLICAGVSINHIDFTEILTSLKGKEKTMSLNTLSTKNPLKTYKVHPPIIQFSEIPIAAVQEVKSTKTPDNIETRLIRMPNDEKNGTGKQKMSQAPWLAPVLEDIPIKTRGDGREIIIDNSVMPANSIDHQSLPIGSDSPMGNIFNNMVKQNALISSIHRDFVNQQALVHQHFLKMRQDALSILMNASSQGFDFTDSTLVTALKPAFNTPPTTQEQYNAESHVTSMEPDKKDTLMKSHTSVIDKPPIIPDRDLKDSSLNKKSSTYQSAIARQFSKPEAKKPIGPRFSRKELEILASGKISEVFGPLFEVQDHYHRQVRLPKPPLLLTDRVTGLDAEAGSMGKGIIWTETDVKKDAWYINDIYMPAGVTVEAGQSDLLLISWLGADFKNMGERVYRLLGCDLVYYGSPPKVGDTLCYEIYVDGHANVGDVRIFFFHYDCRINGEIRLSVRNAQAGFFSDEELANSGGVLWEAETGEHKDKADARVDPLIVDCTRSKFSVDQVRAFSQGRVYECFGPGFEIAETHTKTPKLPPGRLLLLHHVSQFNPKGGPWGRGYLRSEYNISPDEWFLTCHFKNDPCMPGTLMSDACLQTLAFYVTAMGFTLNKDGWRFDPVPDEIYHIICRGQVTPKSNTIIYETFVEEVIDSPYPTVYADILATCDGLKILHIRRLGIRLVPDWPLNCWPELIENHEETRPVASVGDFRFDYKSLLACAWGRPSDAFGENGKAFDGPRHIARLPGPPYHFMSRISKLEAEMGSMKSGESIEVEYDVPTDAWYFDMNGNPTMPFCVLMEVAMQPCGWLAVFEGCPASTENDLYFRNIDGTGRITAEILPNTETIRTRTTLTSISRMSNLILVNFDVICFVEETPVYNMKTRFGFFPKEALDQQIGLPSTEDEKGWLEESCDFLVDLTELPDRYFNGKLRLPRPMLLMLDRITGYWPKGGGNGLRRLRAEKDVNVSEWFFKAHFMSDPIQPGSLGVESMVQLLQFYMLHEHMEEGIEHPRFEPLALNRPTTWKYRGQVTPNKKRISVEMNILERGRDEAGAYSVAEAWLWVDELRIFHVKDLGMRIVSGNPPTKAEGGTRHNKKNNSNNIENMIKEAVADKANVNPSTVRFIENRNVALCEAMPLTLYPVEMKDKKNKAPLVKLGEPFLDFDRMLSYGRKIWGLGQWIGEKITQGLCEQFTRFLILEDPAILKSIHGRSVLYLANHQVQVESMLFPMMMQVLTEKRVMPIANSDHQNGWIGMLNEFTYSYPGVTYPRNIVFFDQNDRRSMFDIIEGFKAMIDREGISVFLHVEGKLGLSCRNPVKILSSVFIDMAISSNLPIVPIRFIGGLPVEEMGIPLDFPVGYCKQDYYIGSPIFPEELNAMPYAERRKYVIKSINNLGHPNKTEKPNPPNTRFKKEVEAWMAKTGSTEIKAVLFKVLEGLTDTTDKETQALINAIREGKLLIKNNEKGKWISDLAQWLIEPRKLKIAYSDGEH